MIRDSLGRSSSLVTDDDTDSHFSFSNSSSPSQVIIGEKLKIVLTSVFGIRSAGRTTSPTARRTTARYGLRNRIVVV